MLHRNFQQYAYSMISFSSYFVIVCLILASKVLFLKWNYINQCSRAYFLLIFPIIIQGLPVSDHFVMQQRVVTWERADCSSQVDKGWDGWFDWGCLRESQCKIQLKLCFSRQCYSGKLQIYMRKTCGLIRVFTKGWGQGFPLATMSMTLATFM